ncbi:MAG: hypothetical protein QOK02_970, partial [Mycobacterium sp.]|nr:hypothetical protein [Mycobacterium sp.]
MMRLRRPRDWMALGAAVVLTALGGLTAACGNGGNPAPSSTTTTTTTATTTTDAPPSSAPASPTEKSIDPSGGNLFTPKAVAPP